MFSLETPENINALPKSIVKKIKTRVKYVNDGISRIEKASGITYPPYNIRPMILFSESEVELGQRGVIYARVIPEEGPAGLLISVELSAPLVAFGLKGTIQAVLAHEFMHYVELVRKFTTLDILSDETVGTLHETIYSDYERLYEPKWLFQDRGLVRLINSRFLDGLVDDRLNNNTLRKWVKKDLPSVTLSPDANVVRIPIASILRTNFDPLLKNKLEELERIRTTSNA
jgi:hypothetical protein|tara:strand:+ start:547 stop:1233 length:687 start_codon:yes stop_codon:yes gene_type:complete